MAQTQKTYKLTEVRVRLSEGNALYSDQALKDPETAAEVLKKELAQYDREVLCVVNLNTRLKPINFNIVAIGGIDSAQIEIPNIFKSCILSNAASFMLFHNHPSGEISPSNDDILTTSRVIRAAQVLGIKCQDHIIVGKEDGEYYSFREHGTIDFKSGEPTGISDDRGTYEVPGKDQKMAAEKTYPSASEKMKAVTDRLEKGIKEIFESEHYQEYLKTMSKFHNYSFNNTLLIYMQKPEASVVAGFESWQKNFGRFVKKGEKGIRILAPITYKVKAERDKIDQKTHKAVIGTDGKIAKEAYEQTRASFKPTTVFDVSQTDGKPLPELGVDQLSGDVKNYGVFLEALKKVSPVPISFEKIDGAAQGYFSRTEHKIAIKEGMSEVQNMKTMIHEITHAKLHDIDQEHEKDIPADKRKDSHTREVESESVAYAVCEHYGIDTSDYSFGYIAGWSSGKDVKELKSSMETIRSTASELIKDIDGRLKGLDLEKETEKPLSQEEKINDLATRLDQFTFNYDPYEYNDETESREDGLAQTKDQLQNDTSGVREWLQGVIDEHGENSEEAAKLLAEVTALGTLPYSKETITNAMSAAGFELDKINSTDNDLHWRNGNGQEMHTASWKDAAEWIDFIVLDDHIQSDAVEKITHPEHFKENAPASPTFDALAAKAAKGEPVSVLAMAKAAKEEQKVKAPKAAVKALKPKTKAKKPERV